MNTLVCNYLVPEGWKELIIEDGSSSSNDDDDDVIPQIYRFVNLMKWMISKIYILFFKRLTEFII